MFKHLKNILKKDFLLLLIVMNNIFYQLKRIIYIYIYIYINK